MLQLLNSYLLPAVSFEVQDAPFLQMAIEDHDTALRHIDHKIEDVSEKYKESKEEVSRVISDLAPVCSDLLKSTTLPRNRLKSLYDDIDKEFRKAQEDVSPCCFHLLRFNSGNKFICFINLALCQSS